MVLLLGHIKLGLAKEPPDGSQVHVPAQDRNSDLFRIAECLQTLHEVVALGFVNCGCPVIFEVYEKAQA
jgi:hypothetical protein